MKHTIIMALCCAFAHTIFAANNANEFKDFHAKISIFSSMKVDTNYYQGQTIYVNASELNLRGGPSTDYDRVKLLARGTALTFMEDYGEFVKVKTKDGYMGYVAKMYTSDVKKAAPSTTISNNTTTTKDPYPYNYKVYDYEDLAYIIANEVNLREGPSTNYEKKGLLKKGDAVYVLGDEEKQPNGELFIRVEVGKTGAIGYVVKRFIK